MSSLEDQAAACIAELARQQQTISLAESCTAGRLTTLLTNVPGASAVVAGGLVAYQDRVKQQLLSVSEQLLQRQCTVSPQCAKEMAEGVSHLMNTDWSVAITGSCGPTRLDPHSQVGEVYIVIRQPGPQQPIWTEIACLFQGSRTEIAESAARAALQQLAKLCGAQIDAH